MFLVGLVMILSNFALYSRGFLSIRSISSLANKRNFIIIYYHYHYQPSFSEAFVVVLDSMAMVQLTARTNTIHLTTFMIVKWSLKCRKPIIKTTQTIPESFYWNRFRSRTSIQISSEHIDRSYSIFWKKSFTTWKTMLNELTIAVPVILVHERWHLFSCIWRQLYLLWWRIERSKGLWKYLWNFLMHRASHQTYC